MLTYLDDLSRLCFIKCKYLKIFHIQRRASNKAFCISAVSTGIFLSAGKRILSEISMVKEVIGKGTLNTD